MNEFKLEVANTNEYFGMLEEDEVVVSTVIQPKGNGEDLAVMEIQGQLIVSPFTRFGNQILLVGERIRVLRVQHVKIIGKVIDGTHKQNKKTDAVTSALVIQPVN